MISTMADLGKGKEKAIEGESATAPSDHTTSGNSPTNVAPQDDKNASPLKDRTASSDAQEEVATSMYSAEASAGQAIPTGLPSDTVEGPASTAELVNPLVLVVSKTKSSSQHLAIKT